MAPSVICTGLFILHHIVFVQVIHVAPSCISTDDLSCTIFLFCIFVTKVSVFNLLVFSCRPLYPFVDMIYFPLFSPIIRPLGKIVPILLIKQVFQRSVFSTCTVHLQELASRANVLNPTS
jgi:hypothetical protein